MGGAAIDVANIPQTRGLLARFEPDLMKRLDSRLGAVTRDIKSGAQALFERTGATGTAYRVKSRNSVGRSRSRSRPSPAACSAGEKWSSEPGVLAAIFELMAAPRDAQPQNVERVRSLIRTLNERYGTPGRFLWETWDERGEGALKEVDAAVREAEAEYTARLRA